MANPQKEHGYTAIANETMDKLCGLKLSDYESRIIHVIFRKTYGWDKKEDVISLSQFSKLTGILTQHVARTIKDLVNRNIIKTKKLNSQSIIYSFQKDYELWDNKTKLDSILDTQLLPNEVVPNQVIPNEVIPTQVLPIQDSGTTNSGSQVLPKQVDTITTIQNKSTKTNIIVKTPFDNLVTLYEECIGELNITTVECLKYAIAEYSEDWIVEALREANKRQVRNWKYVEKILVNKKSNNGQSSYKGNCYDPPTPRYPLVFRPKELSK